MQGNSFFCIMKQKKFLLYLICLLLLIALVVIIFRISNNRATFNENIDNQKTTPMKSANVNNANLEIVSNPALESEYEKSVKNIINAFEEKQKKPNEARDAILALTVPDKYKNLHLDLVVIFDNIIEGAKNSDQAEIQDAVEKLQEIEDKNEWMK